MCNRVDGEKSPEKEAQAAADGERDAALEGKVTGSICHYNCWILSLLFRIATLLRNTVKPENVREFESNSLGSSFHASLKSVYFC